MQFGRGWGRIKSCILVAALILGACVTVVAGNSGSVAIPQFTPGATRFTGDSCQVTLSCATSGATIRYTINGQIPTESDQAYAGPITVTSTSTIKAKCFMSGMNASPEQQYTYVKGDPVVAKPALKPGSTPLPGGSVPATISRATGGTTAGHTTNGSGSTGPKQAPGGPSSTGDTTTVNSSASSMTPNGTASGVDTKPTARVAAIMLVDANSAKRFSTSQLFMVVDPFGSRQCKVSVQKDLRDNALIWASKQPDWSPAFAIDNGRTAWTWKGKNSAAVACTAAGVSKNATITIVSQDRWAADLDVASQKLQVVTNLLRDIVQKAGGNPDDVDCSFHGEISGENVDKYASPQTGVRLGLQDIGAQASIGGEIPIWAIPGGFFGVDVGVYLEPGLSLNLGVNGAYDESLANPWGASGSCTLGGSLAAALRAKVGDDDVVSASAKGYVQASTSGNLHVGYENSIPGIFGSINIGETVLGGDVVVESGGHEIFHTSITRTIWNGCTIPSGGDSLVLDLRTLGKR